MTITDSCGNLSDTKWSLGDYNSSLIALGDKINPGQSDVRLGWLTCSITYGTAFAGD